MKLRLWSNPMISRILRSRGFLFLLSLFILYGAYHAWMRYTGVRKIDPSVLAMPNMEGPLTLEVDLPFRPEALHLEVLQRYGRVRRVRGQKIFLEFRDVGTAKQLMTSYYWISGLSQPPHD
jgi:hypothetical protein